MLRSIRHKARVFLSTLREKRKEHQRSSEWRHVRDKFLKENPACAACGSSKKLQVHHMMPFHIHPELELDEKNLITLCMDDNECHLIIGHGDSWRSYNPHVKEDSIKFSKADEPHREFLIEEVKSRRIHGVESD